MDRQRSQHHFSPFIVLLLTGLLSFGFIAMIIYLVVGPDGTAARAERSFGSRQPVPLARLGYRVPPGWLDLFPLE